MDTLLKELKALRVAVNLARGEAAEHHRELVHHLDDVKARLDRIDDRVAEMETVLTAGSPKLATGNLVTALRTAMMNAT